MQTTVAVLLEASRQPEHPWQIGTGDIGIDQAHLGTGLAQNDGEIGGHGRHPNAAVVRGNSNDVFDAGDLGLPLTRREGRHHGIPINRNSGSPRRQEGSGNILLDRVAQRASRSREDDRERDRAVLHCDVANHIETNEVPLEFWVHHAA